MTTNTLPTNPDKSPAPTFESTDRLDLKGFCERLERYLLVEQDYVDGGLVVALNAGFGAGKTTFIRMWESDLVARRQGGKFVPMPVVLNAWESDYCGDPLLAILASLLEAVSEWKDDDDVEKRAALKDAAKDVASFALSLGNDIAAKWTGLNIIKAGEFAEEKKNARNPEPPSILDLYLKRTLALQNLKEKLNNLFGGPSPKVLVFVDELDRCRPDYAVSYLETIKHVFDAEGMVFILAVDAAQLAISTRALYGQNLDFEEYFRKFCHRTISLPEPDAAAIERLARDYVEKYLEVEGKRASGIKLSDRIKDIEELAIALKLRPRQLQEAFRIVGHVCAVEDEKNRGETPWCIAAGTILLVFLRVGRSEIYSKIRLGRLPHEELGRFLIPLVGTESAERWFQLYVAGLGNEAVRQLDIVELFSKAGFPRLAIENSGKPGTISEFFGGWGRSSRKPLADVLRRIENVDVL